MTIDMAGHRDAATADRQAGQQAAVIRTAVHDLNNALAPITGFAELLTLHASIASDPTLASYARLIFEAAQRAAEPVGRLQRLIYPKQDTAAL